MIDEILKTLHTHANPLNVAGMVRFGINPQNTLGISIPILRKMAKEIKTNHPLAMDLWATGIHEARLLAAFIADPKRWTDAQMDAWVADFDSWDICDQVCINQFRKTPAAYQKAITWASRPEAFVRRAAFSLMATLSVHDKKVPDIEFDPFFECIREQAIDDRNFVKKAVNWALRQIGKRNDTLRHRAIDVAESLLFLDSRAARWIARDALRELRKDN